MHACLNMDKSLRAGLSTEIFSMKVDACVYFENGDDRFCQGQATRKNCEI